MLFSEKINSALPKNEIEKRKKLRSRLKIIEESLKIFEKQLDNIIQQIELLSTELKVYIDSF